MPLPISRDATWLNPATVQLDAGELRRADTALFAGASPLDVFGGIVRHGDTALRVTVDGNDTVTVQPGAVVIPGNAVSGTGCYRASLEAVTTGALTARNATNPRIDLVIFRALDTDVVGTHGAYTARIEVLPGVPAAVPVAPALPSMAVELGRITVPKAGGGAASVDLTRRTFACASGGTLPVASSALLPASAASRQKARALDTGLEYEWDAAAAAWTRAGKLGPFFPALGGGWTTYGEASQTVHYYLLNGAVHAAGVITGGAFGSTLFTLPAGYRPWGRHSISCIAASAAARIVVEPTGQVVPTTGSNAWFGFSFSFVAEQ